MARWAPKHKIGGEATGKIIFEIRFSDGDEKLVPEYESGFFGATEKILLTSTNTANPYQNTHLNIGSTPRLKNQIPQVDTHA